MTQAYGLEVGIVLQEPAFARGSAALRDELDAIDGHGIDFVGVLDHVSFWGGAGFDGLINATAVAAAHPTLPIRTAVYVLPLRHPVTVARQLSSLALVAGDRVTFGVGVGGENRAEVEAAGVDPATRGRRMDECLAVLRDLTDHGCCSFDGDFFTLDAVQVLPRPATRIPILVGGRSDAALRRTGRFGDGWLAFAVSPDRYARAVKLVDQEAELLGRFAEWQHGIVVWCCFDDHHARARAMLAHEMETLYRTPYDKFARYCAVGSPDDVAAFIAEYHEAGCRSFSLVANPAGSTAAIEGVARVRELLVDSAA